MSKEKARRTQIQRIPYGTQTLFRKKCLVLDMPILLWNLFFITFQCYFASVFPLYSKVVIQGTLQINYSLTGENNLGVKKYVNQVSNIQTCSFCTTIAHICSSRRVGQSWKLQTILLRLHKQNRNDSNECRNSIKNKVILFGMLWRLLTEQSL